MPIWIYDPKTKQPSVTLTLFAIAFLIASVKLLLSGNIVGGLKFSDFSGTDFAAVVGAAGSIYGWRKYQDGKEIEPEMKPE